jgi:hypothetical protein
VGLARTILPLIGLGALCSCGPGGTPLPGGTVPAQASAAVRTNDMSNFEARSLAFHNELRAEVGVPPLAWDPALAANAANYGPPLAALRGPLAHSPAPLRVGQGENLWRGTSGAFSLEAMLGSWAGEKSWFRPGIFPAISTTGNWVHVGHYTTMIWPGTTHVGCALYREAPWDYLICRYAPAGNIPGQKVP